MHTTNDISIINLLAPIIEGLDKCGSDNPGSTVLN